MIEVRNIHKSYGSGRNRHEVLKGIDIAFRENEFVAILGPSGSGKTTLLNVIGGLDHYDRGDLVIRGISTRAYSARDWDSYRNHSVGFIFQSYNLIEHQSILSNVEMALTISGISGKQRRERALETLKKVGLEEHVFKRPSQLSGGQMQRVAIARALVNDPTVVLADEPTGALDSKTSVQVMELLKEIARDRLIIMVTHNPELAQAYATRIVTLKDGEIAGDTAPYIPEGPAGRTAHRKVNMGRSSMRLPTALSLSFHNLWSKRSRTLLTAFAGSIGIIGIALIIALSSGVNEYIDRQEANMSYQYPLLVETLNMDISSMLTELSGQLSEEGEDRVKVLGFLESLFSTLGTNDLEKLKTYLEEEENDISQYGTIEYVYNITPQIYVEYEGEPRRVCPDSTLESLGIPVSSIDTSLISSTISTDMFYCMPRDEKLYLERYDIKAGRWPENGNECVLVLTPDGSISDYLLYVMGMRDPGKVDEYIEEFLEGGKVEPEQLEGLSFDYEEFLNVSFKLVNSSDYYSYDEESGLWRDRSNDKAFIRELVKQGEELNIVGVVQPKEGYGVGALSAGINYPFSLIEKTIENAAGSEAVAAQMEDTETNIFTGLPFEDSNAAAELDPSTIVSVDSEKIREALKVDQQKLQQYFLEGANLEAIQVSIPELDVSGIQIENQVVEAVLAQLAADLPELLGEIQLPEDALYDMVGEILYDYMDYLEEMGYSNYGDISEAVSAYFYSEAFYSVLENWAASLDMENTEEGYWPGKIQELSEALLYSMNAYLESQGLPQLPQLETTFRDYLATGRWRTIVRRSIDSMLESSRIEEVLEAYIQDTLRPLIDSQLELALQDLTAQLETASATVSAQLQAAVSSSIINGLSNALAHGEECISLDMDLFAQAFTMKLDIQELSDFLLSFTGISKPSAQGNLQKLGYVGMSHPKSIKIYPRDFESKDAVIDVLDRYNLEMELLGEKSSSISYTDTLGAVMNTVGRIVTIITSALIATVAVSLVVSSIMIGVITYISVLERKKEIGILRAMGASKHNISQIFNAETFITGLLSGAMGVGLAYILIIPMNLFLQKATQIGDIAAFLPVGYALGLVLISVVLTTLGGLIPAHNASKSDPVEALRSE